MLERLRLPLAVVLALSTVVSCNRKSEAQVQAEAAAGAAQAKVAELESRLVEARGGAGQSGGKESGAELAHGQVKSLERQLADAKRRAETKRREAEDAAHAPTAPMVRWVEVPAGTALQVKLGGPLATDQVRAGDGFAGSLAAPVQVDQWTVWPAGTPVRGVVAQSVPAGRLAGGKGVLAIRLTEVGGEGVEAGSYVVHGGPSGERNAKFIGGGALIGALAGILSDPRNRSDHALGGAAIGAAAGTAAAAASADTVLRIGAAAPIEFRLTAPERIAVRR